MNTDPTKSGPLGLNGVVSWTDSDVQGWAKGIDDYVRQRPDIDFLIGFSLGGRAVAEWLNEQGWRRTSGSLDNVYIGTQVKSVLLIHPFMDCFCMANGAVQLKPMVLNGAWLAGVRIVMRNDNQDVFAPGDVVDGGFELWSNGDCGGFPNHCTSPNTAMQDVSLALDVCLPPLACTGW
jgi:hypothetical protein